MQTFGISDGGGLDALVKALGYRLYAAVNRQEAERVDGNTLTLECTAPQTANKAT